MIDGEDRTIFDDEERETNTVYLGEEFDGEIYGAVPIGELKEVRGRLEHKQSKTTNPNERRGFAVAIGLLTETIEEHTE